MKFNKNVATIHGYLCGDGYVSTNSPTQKHKYYSIGFRNNNNALLKDFQNNFYEYFKIKVKLIKNQRCRLYSKKIYNKLMENGPYYSNNWSLPNLSKENLKYWLKAFFDCEGWTECIKRQNRRVSIESINHKGLEDIQKVLLKFNIKSKIRERKKRVTKILNILDKNSIINFENKIGFKHPNKKIKLRKVIESFMIYKWNISNSTIIKLMKEKSKIKKLYIVAIFSINKENLNKLSYLLKTEYKIESKIYKNKNGYGKIYYYLAVQKKDEVKKLIKNGLLNKKTINKLTKSLLS